MPNGKLWKVRHPLSFDYIEYRLHLHSIAACLMFSFIHYQWTVVCF